MRQIRGRAVFYMVIFAVYVGFVRIGAGRGGRVWERVALVALAVLLAVSVPGLFADEPVAPTDTTIAGGTDSGQDPSTRDHCPYGHRSDGTCRSCPRRTYRRSGGACVPVSQTPGCPVAYAKVSSWPGVCVPIFCQDNPANPNLLEWRNLTTGNCIDKCTTSGFEWFSRYKSCRPSSCPHGRYSNGNCRPAPPPPSTTTTVAATTTTTVPVTTTTVPAMWSSDSCFFTFPKGTAASVALPTHNKANRYTLRGILPPGVSATPKTGGSFTLDRWIVHPGRHTHRWWRLGSHPRGHLARGLGHTRVRLCGTSTAGHAQGIGS